MDDPRPLLDRALIQIGGLHDAVPADRLDAPTPCDGWDVATLLGHLLSVHRRIAHVATGGDPFDIPHVTDPDDPADPADPTGTRALADAARGVRDAWADDAVLDRVVTVPWGTMPGRVVGWGYVQELTVHAWDLARPLGRVDHLDPALAEAVVETARWAVPDEPRGGRVPFGPPVDVPADAAPYDRLVAWLGRMP